MLETIKTYHATHGVLPTVKELSRILKVTRVTVYKRLEKLEKAGLLKKVNVVVHPGYELIE